VVTALLKEKFPISLQRGLNDISSGLGFSVLVGPEKVGIAIQPEGNTVEISCG